MRDRNSPLTAEEVASLDWAKGDGLLPAIVQDVATGQVLMLGYVSPESLAATFKSGFMTFWSRSRQELWQKGATSGNRLAIREVRGDCDDDTVLILAEPEGPTCHTGAVSCFGGEAPGTGWIAALEKVLAERATADPETSYTARLLAKGPKRIAQKVGEEGVETALAGVAGDDAELLSEGADLIYHLSVLLASRGLKWEQLVEVLRERHK
jgi:phosphoribosyl-AMP cyclohydrolase / phosphoribosyl-ATP pyrophosphohydrolase